MSESSYTATVPWGVNAAHARNDVTFMIRKKLYTLN